MSPECQHSYVAVGGHFRLSENFRKSFISYDYQSDSHIEKLIDRTS